MGDSDGGAGNVPAQALALTSLVTFAAAEAQLRLLNGFYPRGEPRTGDWIKVIR